MKLIADLSNSASTCTVTSTAGFFIGSYAMIDTEAILIIDIQDTTLTIERAKCNTTAASHLVNSIIYPFFGWPVYRDSTKDTNYPINRVQFANGYQQRQRLTVHPIVKWEVNTQGLNAEMKAIQRFCDLRFGGTEDFKWIDTSGELQTVFLGSDNVKITEKRALESGKWEIVAYTLAAPLVFIKSNI